MGGAPQWERERQDMNDDKIASMLAWGVMAIIELCVFSIIVFGIIIGVKAIW